MKILLLAFVVALPLCMAQVGVKTRPAPQPSSGNLVYNGTQEHRGSEGYDFGHDEHARFLNRTRGEMPTGVCLKEVPTATLVRNADYVPAGNGSDPSLSLIQVCCDGYERNMHNYRQCDPVCVGECVNGICVAPNVCSCFPGHVVNLAGFCLATCPIGCGNGECSQNGECVCNPGYVIDPNTHKFCVPRCTGCTNGNCTAPEQCSCRAGFEPAKSAESIEKCVPKCDNCAGGVCSAPGVCTCRPGYIKMERSCVPVCSRGCSNGECTAPDTCTCRPGFTLDQSGANCIAHCDAPCLNGFCSGSNSCSCNPGYIQDQFNPFVCNAHCPLGCPNGVCSSPGFCICNPGYVKDRSVKTATQACVPRV